MDDLGNVDALITWLMTGGVVVVVSWCASWALEKWSWWQALSSKTRAVLILISSSVLGVCTVVLVHNPVLFEAIKPYAQVILTTIIAWLGTQTAHRADSERK